jgi:hypothetical protein
MQKKIPMRQHIGIFLFVFLGLFSVLYPIPPITGGKAKPDKTGDHPKEQFFPIGVVPAFEHTEQKNDKSKGVKERQAEGAIMLVFPKGFECFHSYSTV